MEWIGIHITGTFAVYVTHSRPQPEVANVPHYIPLYTYTAKLRRYGRGVSVKIHHPDSQKNHNPLPLWEKIRCSGVEV